MFFTIHRRTIAFVVVACILGLGIHVNNVFYKSDEVVNVSSTQATSLIATDWGLSFQTLGEPPIANATSEELAQYNAFYIGDTTKKTIYLTFDCGYENGYTESILDTLKKHDVKATFFIVGTMLETAPEIVKRMADEGHTVGNHTMTHPDMSQISDKDSFVQELEQLSTLYEEVTGYELSNFYRPPQGKFSIENLQMANELGYKTVFWSLAYVDWYVDNQPTHDQAFDKLVPRIHNGAVLLLHSTSKTNAEILDELLTEYKGRGYEIGALEEVSF